MSNVEVDQARAIWLSPYLVCQAGPHSDWICSCFSASPVSTVACFSPGLALGELLGCLPGPMAHTVPCLLQAYLQSLFLQPSPHPHFHFCIQSDYKATDT